MAVFHQVVRFSLLLCFYCQLDTEWAFGIKPKHPTLRHTNVETETAHTMSPACCKHLCFSVPRSIDRFVRHQ